MSEPRAWDEWVAGVEPVAASLALVRLAALAVVAYCLAVTAVGIGLRLIGAARPSSWVARGVAAADRVTVPPLRRWLAAAAGLTLAASPALLATGGRAPPVLAATLPGGPGPTSTLPGGPGPTSTVPGGGPPPTLTMRLVGPGPLSAPPTTAAPEAGRAPGAIEGASVDDGEHVVRRGECFWSIANDVLAAAWSREPTDGELVPYWRELIAANRDRLLDPANADLIYPGQVFHLPPPPMP